MANGKPKDGKAAALRRALPRDLEGQRATPTGAPPCTARARAGVSVSKNSLADQRSTHSLLSVLREGVAILIGIPSGIVSAVWRNSFFDGCSRIFALTGVSMPIFWLGLMLAWVFGVMLGWLPTGFRLGTNITLVSVTNFNLLDSVITGNGEALVASVRHLILPAVALSTIPMAVITRMTRASLLEVLSQDYIRTAESKGLPQRAVVLRHAMRNALLPVMTVTGLQVGRLLAGAILTETIFSWPGIGLWIYEAIQARDYPIVQGATLFIATIFVTVNLVTDRTSQAAAWSARRSDGTSRPCRAGRLRMRSITCATPAPDA